MERPFIVCHMVESLDGRIDCAMVEHISGDEYYKALEALDCQASVEGRVTMEHYYALPGEFEQQDPTPVGEEKWFRASERVDFHICIQTEGKLLWESNQFEDGRPLLIITSERCTLEYLDWLEELGISYIAAGKDGVDLGRAMELLRKEFEVERLAVLGGGVTNGAFLEAGLLDEVSMLIAPGIDGRGAARASFDGIRNTEREPFKLKLSHLGQYEGDVVWLRYTVVH